MTKEEFLLNAIASGGPTWEAETIVGWGKLAWEQIHGE